jgi:predicted RNase H-like nuclease (RuvC/YqgF family)
MIKKLATYLKFLCFIGMSIQYSHSIEPSSIETEIKNIENKTKESDSIVEKLKNKNSKEEGEETKETCDEKKKELKEMESLKNDLNKVTTLPQLKSLNPKIIEFSKNNPPLIAEKDIILARKNDIVAKINAKMEILEKEIKDLNEKIKKFEGQEKLLQKEREELEKLERRKNKFLSFQQMNNTLDKILLNVQGSKIYLKTPSMFVPSTASTSARTTPLSSPRNQIQTQPFAPQAAQRQVQPNLAPQGKLAQPAPRDNTATLIIRRPVDE